MAVLENQLQLMIWDQLMKSERGQSIVEIIFSIGVIAVVIVGVVSLVVNIIGVKTTSLKRKKATELGNVLIEKLIQDRLVNPEVFWELKTVDSTSLTGFENYQYSIGFTEVSDISGCTKQASDPVKCADAVINITWDEGKSSLLIKRFFSRKG